jgi:hypothetical protein
MVDGSVHAFVGALFGNLWISSLEFILFLSIAGGALIYFFLCTIQQESKPKAQQ